MLQCRFVPLAAHICRILRERNGRQAPRRRFGVELEDHLTEGQARKRCAPSQLGRYAELFAYDDKTQTFSLIAAV